MQGLLALHAGELGREVEGDPGAEDRGGPGEPRGVDAESFEAGDESTAAGRAVEGAQFGGRGLARLQLAVLHLGEEFDGLVRVAAGDGPHLAAERGVGVHTDRGPGEPCGRLGGECAEGGDRAGRGGDHVEVTGALLGGLAGAAGDHHEDGQVVEALGERGQPVQGLLVGPVRVVDQQDQRPLAPGQSAHRRDQAVAHALRVGLAVARLGDPERGPRDVVPVAQVFARLVGHERDERGLQQLPYDIEGNGRDGLAAACRPHRAAAALRDPARLAEQRGLADARLTTEHQQASRARGRGVRAQGVDRLHKRGDLRVAFPQGSRGDRSGPYLRHPATSPDRPNGVQALSLVLRRPRRRRSGHVLP